MILIKQLIRKRSHLLKNQNRFVFSILILISIFISSLLFAQDQVAAQGGLTDAEKARENNLLTDTKAVNLQHYYRPTLSEIEGLNFFVEPQHSLLTYVPGQPIFQI